MTTSTAKATKTTVDLTANRAEVDELLKQFNDAKAAIAAQKAIKKLAENRLRELLGDAEMAVVEGKGRYWLSHNTNTGIDRDKLLAIAPAAYAECFKSTPYTQLYGK